MEFFLWFWLLDRRFCCNMRPLLKQFAFLWIIPIIIHLVMVMLNIYILFFPFNNFSKSQYIIIGITFIEFISILCLFFMMINLYKISKKQPKKKNKNIFILFYEKIKSKDEKENFIYYEDYWIARKILLSWNGIFILFLSIIHILWSFYFLINRTLFQEIYKSGEKFYMSYCYLNILFCAPVFILLGYAMIVKFSFVLCSMCCTNCTFYISEKCSKKNKGLEFKIDFSDVQRLEPQYI